LQHGRDRQERQHLRDCLQRERVSDGRVLTDRSERLGTRWNDRLHEHKVLMGGVIRMPAEIVAIFDAACAEFARAGRETDLLVMGAAFDRLADAAGELAAAIARADRASGLLPPRTPSA
jgi:hypothetical protein